MRRLKDYGDLFKALSSSICEKTSLESEIPLEQIFRNPRLIVTINHATALSWIPAVTFLTAEAIKAGGGERISIGVMDKFFFGNPLTQPLAEYITQSKTPRSFDELLEEMRHWDQTDLVIFPEGARSFFGSVSEIQPFRSPRFIELAVRAQAPLLLAVHRGSEDWNLNVPLPSEWGSFLLPLSSFFAKGLQQFGSLNLPLNLKKIPHFRMALKLYPPALYEADLSEDPTERRSQLEAEAENVRAIMQEMWEGLGPIDAANS